MPLHEGHFSPHTYRCQMNPKDFFACYRARSSRLRPPPRFGQRFAVYFTPRYSEICRRKNKVQNGTGDLVAHITDRDDRVPKDGPLWSDAESAIARRETDRTAQPAKIGSAEARPRMAGLYDRHTVLSPCQMPAATTTAAAYDEVPFPSQAVAQSHPDRLALLPSRPACALFDRCCRVLELGFAAGDNLIP